MNGTRAPNRRAPVVTIGDRIAMTGDGGDERSLVERAQRGDTDAFATLLRSQDDKMRAFAYRLTGDRVAMDDVLQDAYLKAFRSLASYQQGTGAEGKGKFGSWLFSVVHSCAMDHHRRAARQPNVSLDAMSEHAAPVAHPAGDHASTIVDRERISAALASLPSDQAAAVALVDGDGYSYDQVAELLGINPGTVASRLSRGRAAMRQHLNLDDVSIDRDSDGRTAR